MADQDYMVKRQCLTEAEHMTKVAECWLEDTTEHINQCNEPKGECSWCDAFEELHNNKSPGLVHYYERHTICPGVKAQP